MIYHWCHNTPLFVSQHPGVDVVNTRVWMRQHPIVRTTTPSRDYSHTWVLRRQDIYVTALNHISYGGKRYFCLYIIYVEIMTLGFCNHCNILLT